VAENGGEWLAVYDTQNIFGKEITICLLFKFFFVVLQRE
jgi:hypothetical protein